MENHKHITKGFYNRNAEKYAEKHLRLFAQQKNEVRRFLELVPGKRILDLGAGPGDHAKHFMDIGYSVKAIDYSEKMVEMAKAKGVDAEEMDIEDLNFSDGSFDGIWSATSLLHIRKEDLPKTLNKLRNILAKDGILYLSLFEGRGERYIADGGVEEKRYFAFWERDELRKLLHEYFEEVDFFSISVREKHFLEYFLKKK